MASVTRLGNFYKMSKSHRLFVYFVVLNRKKLKSSAGLELGLSVEGDHTDQLTANTAQLGIFYKIGQAWPLFVYFVVLYKKIEGFSVISI